MKSKTYQLHLAGHYNNKSSAFRISESFANISDYEPENSLKVFPECTTTTRDSTIFGFDEDNAASDGSDLVLTVPCSTNQADTLRKGGEVYYDTAYQYGRFKATIKIDIDSCYYQGAFWLGDLVGTFWQETIFMEIYRHPNNGPMIDCVTVYNAAKEDSGYIILNTVLDSIPDMTEYNEYQIEWAADFIKFYFNGECIHTTDANADIPTQNLTPFFSYKIVPWSGGTTNCYPPTADSDRYFKCQWAAY
ncbi:family 16 glycosylhydrolase [candidate division KSB1 bacterium]|nr:family 16 glycosylhydrolase [candidate division KSB1 bacterium]